MDANCINALIAHLENAPKRFVTFETIGREEICEPEYLTVSDRDMIVDLLEKHKKFEIMWQPISTAPTDGSEVLLFGRRDGEPVYAVDWYRQPKDECGFIGFGSFNESYWPATHWMPLPAPPDRKE